MRVFIILMSTCLVLSAFGYSATLNVPGTYPTIQQAINAAADGDMVLVDPGIYPETVSYTHLTLPTN